mgnify:CR=1 FL=1
MHLRYQHRDRHGHLGLDDRLGRLRLEHQILVHRLDVGYRIQHRLDEVRAIADEIGAKVLFDAAHMSGMIAGQAWQQPLEEGAHLMTMSTYKSLGGPAGGLIVTRDMRLADFLAEVGRYRHGYLGCSADIADLRLSGVFRLEDTDKLLAILPQTLPVRLRYRSRWWVSLERSA